MSDVWVLDFDAEGPEASDFAGYRSVHASRDGAVNRLMEHMAGLGIDLSHGQTLAAATADNGSYSADVVIEGVEISYGVHRVPVED